MSVDAQIIEQARSSDPDARQKAAALVAQSTDEHTLPLMFELLGDKDWRVRKTIVDGLVRDARLEIVGGLLDALSDAENAGKRNSSTEALVRAYNEDAEKKRALIKRSEAAKAPRAVAVTQPAQAAAAATAVPMTAAQRKRVQTWIEGFAVLTQRCKHVSADTDDAWESVLRSVTCAGALARSSNSIADCKC